MAMAILSWTLAIPLLGMMTGLRTMTPIAVLCWFAYLGDLPVGGTWAFWCGKLVTAIVFTVFAAGEYVGDKLPQTPNRTAVAPLLARLAFAGLVGAICDTGVKGPIVEGVFLGIVGGLVGAFVGYQVRKRLVQWSGRPDWNVALLEDASAVLLSVLALGVITG